MAIKLEGRGGKALMAWPIVEELFFFCGFPKSFPKNDSLPAFESMVEKKMQMVSPYWGCKWNKAGQATLGESRNNVWCSRCIFSVLLLMLLKCELMLSKCQINRNMNKNEFLLPTKGLEGVLKYSYLNTHTKFQLFIKIYICLWIF